jgi:hypothetical protein
VVPEPSEQRAGFYASFIGAVFAALMLGTYYLGWMPDGVVRPSVWWFLLGANIVGDGICYIRDRADMRAEEARRRAVR